MALNPGRYTQFVTLDDPVPDGTVVTFAPARIKVSMLNSGSSEKIVSWQVEGRYHPQVTMNTRMTLDDGRQLFVRAHDNIGNVTRSNVMRLVCEEVVTP